MTQVETKSLDTLGIDWGDFYKRWTKARVAAILKVIDSDLELSLEDDTEKGLLLQVFEFMDDCTEDQSDKMKTDLYRNIFDHSRALGLGLGKKFNVAFELTEFREILSKSSISNKQEIAYDK